MNFQGSGEGGGYKQPKPGLQAARIYRIADLGTQDDTYQGKPKRARKMMVWFELAQKMEDGKPFSLFREYNTNLNAENCGLRKDMESWTGKTMTPEIIKNFDPKRLMLGKACMVNVVLKNEKAKVMGIMAVPEGVAKPEPHNPQAYFDLDDFDSAAFEALPAWIQNKVMVSPEYKKATEGHHEEGRHNDGPPPGSADDIPF